MKTLKKLLPLCLVLCLLVGCAPKESAATPTPDAAAEENFTFLTSGIVPGTVIATVNGEYDVTVDDYLFWLALYLDTYRSQGYPIDLSTDETMEEEFKAMVLDVTAMYSYLSRHAAELGLTLSEEDEAQVQAEIDGLKTSMGEDFEFWVSSMYKNEESFAESERAMYAGDLLYDYYFAEGGASAPSETDYAAYAADAELYGVYSAKHILLRTVDDARQQLSEEERQVAYERAHEIYARLVEAGGDEASFDAEMFEHSEDTGLEYYPDGYEFGPNEMVPEFEYGTLALVPGTMSEVIESSFGYHIIFRLSVAADSARLREAVLGTLWNDWLDGVQTGLDVHTNEVWDTLDVSSVDAQRTAENEAYDAAKAPAEPEVSPEVSPAA